MRGKRLLPFVLVLGLLISSGLWLHGPRLNTLVWSSDEGIHLSAAYLVAQGKIPYREVAFSQGPLFLELMRWPLVWHTATGNDVTAVRVTLLSFGVLLLVAVALIGRELQNNLAGWIAALALLAMPSFFYFARAVMADLPAVALGMWAAWAALRFFQRGKWHWLVSSGVLLGLSLAIKFLTLYALGWIGLLMLYRCWWIERDRVPGRHWGGHWGRPLRDTLRASLLFGSCTLLTVLAIYLCYDLPVLLTSIFGMRVAMREAFGSWTSKNLDEVAEFWTFHAGLIVLAGYGLLGQLRDPQRAFLLVSWLLLVIASLRVQNPLYHQHLQLLLPLLALFAGLGVATLIEQMDLLRRQGWRLRRVGSVAVGLLLVSWLVRFTVISYQTPNRYTETSTTSLRVGQEPLVEFLEKFTAPHDCVVTDDLNLAFISRRLPPPQLIDLSSARLATESISDERLILLTQSAGCQVVAPLTDRIVELSPGFDQWSHTAFLGKWQGAEATLWLAQPLTNPQPTRPLQTTFADQVLLRGVDFTPAPRQHALYVSLYWQSLKPFPVDYKIFVHLRDSANNTVVNGDHLPYDNLVPTTIWPVGSTIKETIRLDLPANLGVGEYWLAVGMYDAASLVRLPVQGDTSGENALMLPFVYTATD